MLLTQLTPPTPLNIFNSSHHHSSPDPLLHNYFTPTTTPPPTTKPPPLPFLSHFRLNSPLRNAQTRQRKQLRALHLAHLPALPPFPNFLPILPLHPLPHGAWHPEQLPDNYPLEPPRHPAGDLPHHPVRHRRGAFRGGQRPRNVLNHRFWRRVAHQIGRARCDGANHRIMPAGGGDAPPVVPMVVHGILMRPLGGVVVQVFSA